MNVILGMVLVLGVMILVHELGHFLAARFFGVHVDVFSVGFGPRLWGWRRGQTDYRISAIPLGGYVRMAGQDLCEDRKGDPGELHSKPRWQRALIALAGPAVNLVMPVLLLGGFFAVLGFPYPAFFDQPVTIQRLPSNSPLIGMGALPGDRVAKIQDVPNPTWEKALSAVEEARRDSGLRLLLDHEGASREIELTPEQLTASEWPLGYPPVPAVIGEAVRGMPGHRAGLRRGDKVISVDGQPVSDWPQFVDLVRQSGGKPILLLVRREGRDMSLAVQPRKESNGRGESTWKLGVGQNQIWKYRAMGLSAAVREAGAATVRGSGELLGVLAQLFTGKVSVRQLQSFLGIAREAGQAVERGPFDVIHLMALISLNLGVLNLLPIPILDGGHLLLLGIEGTMRRDLSLAVKERFVQVGFVFLLVIFAIVMYNDVVRMLPGQ